jgi:hypothetical protein
MKTNKSGTSSGSRLREALLFGFLALSIVSAVVIVSCHDDMSTLMEPIIPDPPFDEPGPIVGGSASSHAISVLFEGATEGAAGSITEMGMGWALGALGLADEGPDYTEQLEKIEEDLQEIIGQLSDINDELAEINKELLVLNCSEQQTALTTETGRIEYLLGLYQSFVSTANNKGRTPNATLSDWADQVLAGGNYTGQTPMGQILTTMANQLIQPNSGAITACVQAVPKPANTSFGDTYYYDAVSHFTNYYYYYQAQGLMLLNEALHYQAWVAAGSPVSVSIDSVSFVCQDPNAVYFCNQAAVFTNKVYNALIAQFTTGGAPYTNDYFLMATHDVGTPRLWVKSLEDFAQAYGSPCTYPLTSEVPANSWSCGVMAGWWNSPVLGNTFTYRGYTEWGWTGHAHLQQLFNGWNSGTAGQYLETARGFENMTNKVIITVDPMSITLGNAPGPQEFVPFIDTDFDYSFQPRVVDNSASFSRMTHFTATQYNCKAPFFHWSTAEGLPGVRNGFYELSIDYGCNSKAILVNYHWNIVSGWNKYNTTAAARQYLWPVGTTALFTDYCKHNRSSKNVAGVWTMCGNDFTAWFEYHVPRPPTCDNPSFPTCNL